MISIRLKSSGSQKIKDEKKIASENVWYIFLQKSVSYIEMFQRNEADTSESA